MTRIDPPSKRIAPVFVGLVSLALLALVPAVVAAPATAYTPSLSHHWAGNSSLAPAASTYRTARAGAPGLFAAGFAGVRTALSPLSLSTGDDGPDGIWSLLAGSGVPANGPGRIGHSAIHDPVRGRVVVFGGIGDLYLDDTWVLEAGASAWTPLATDGTPPSARWLHTAVYDAAGDRMVVFGGHDGTFAAGVWALSFGSDPPQWSEITPAGAGPVARAGHVAIYDAEGGRMIVFGGHAEVSPERRDDVWALALTGAAAWTDITPAVAGPGPRAGMAAAFDSERRAMVVVGGTGPGFRNDVWSLSLDGVPAWSGITEAVSGAPAPREGLSAIYDEANSRVVIFGGYDETYLYGDAWALDLPAGSWTEVAPTGTSPSPRWGHAAVYDAAGARMILMGGHTASGLSSDTHVLRLSATPSWTNPIVSPGPGPMRHTFASAYDARRHRFVLVGGSDVSNYLNDTWTILLGEHPAWAPVPAQGNPPSPRRLAEAIYDPRGDRLIVFGGWDGTILGDLWQLSFATDPPTWSPLGAVGTPPAPRAGHVMIYDPPGRRMILFGGFDGVSANFRRNDLWELSLQGLPTWRQLSPQGTQPSARSSASAVYDDEERRMIVFGGTTPTFLNDTWALSLEGDGSWTPLAVTGTVPSAREEHSAMYDAVRERMVIFGGYENASFSGTRDTWSLSLRNEVAWSRLTPGGPQPTFRWGHAAVYDPSYDRMVMHGGLGPGLDQTWALTWGQPETANPTLIEAEASSNLVRLTWNVSGGAFLNASIYRSVEDAPWALVGAAQVGPAGETVYEDHGIVPGSRHGYRAGVMAGSTEKLSGDAWVDVPAVTEAPGGDHALAILGVRRSATGLAVQVSLPSSAPARLDLFDVGGRLVASSEFQGPGKGNAEVGLRGGDPIRSGILWLKLRQSGQVVTKRAVLLQ